MNVGSGPDAYLWHLLGWALPVLAAQLFGLWFTLRARFVRTLLAILKPALLVTVFLCAADHLAIAEGVWRFGEGKHLGIYLGRVPLEEVLFFLITNLLVAFGFTLFAELLWKSKDGKEVRP